MFVLVLLCLYTMHSLTHDEIDKLMYACNALNIHPRADTPEDLVNWMHDYISQQGGREGNVLFNDALNTSQQRQLHNTGSRYRSISYRKLWQFNWETETVCQSTRFLDEDG